MSIPPRAEAAAAGDVRSLLENIAKALVDDAAQVSVEAVDEGGETVLELQVAPEDVGKIIGKQGRTARALRIILAAVSVKLHRRYTLEILE